MSAPDPRDVLREALDEICPAAYAVDCDLPEHAKARAGHAALADVDALVEAARRAITGMTELHSLPGVIGTISTDDIDQLRAALARFAGDRNPPA